jgi:hypothetical protein
MCVLCADETETDVEALPNPRVMALAARRHLQEVLAINAARINPDPMCTDCGYLYHRSERGELFRDVCASCETNRLEDLVFDIAFAKSKNAARKALKRFYRKVRRAAAKK